MMNDRNYVLDGIRGVCALAVMLVHLSHFNNLTWFKNAGGAVDAFFIISGFVMMQNYQDKINARYKFFYFLKVRFKRLAPLNTIASCLGFIAILLILLKSNNGFDMTVIDVIKGFLYSILFIPNFNNFAWPYGTEIQVGGIFPINIPAWSLFLEWVAYIFFYTIIRYARAYILYFWIFFVLIYILISFIYQMDNPGWSQSSIWQGVARVLFGFFTGMVICLYKRTNDKINYSLVIFFSVISFSLLLFGDVRFSLLNTFIFVPLTIYFICHLRFTNKINRALCWLGEISYPLYMIHIPLVTGIYILTPQIRSLNPYLQIYLLSIFIIFIAYTLNIFDKKIRHKIKNF